MSSLRIIFTPNFVKYYSPRAAAEPKRCWVKRFIVHLKIWSKSDHIFQKKTNFWHKGNAYKNCAQTHTLYISTKTAEFQKIEKLTRNPHFTWVKIVKKKSKKRKRRLGSQDSSLNWIWWVNAYWQRKSKNIHSHNFEHKHKGKPFIK